MGKEAAKKGDNPKARTLRRAVGVVGSESALAETLGVSPESVSAWLLGEQDLPNNVYMRALDLVSQGPHHQAPRKPK
jgi:DNA-binding transcriptional regulator YiaG